MWVGAESGGWKSNLQFIVIVNLIYLYNYVWNSSNENDLWKLLLYRCSLKPTRVMRLIGK